MTSAPLISVILPFYINVEKEDEGIINNLIIAIDSIIQQTYKEWELLLVDDGCNSNTIDNLLKERYGSDNRVKVIKHNENKGLIHCLNDAILNHTSSTSKYIARMDSDDISHSTRLQLQFQYLQSNQSIDILGCPIKMFNNDKLNNSNKLFTNVNQLITILNTTNSGGNGEEEEFGKFIQHPDKDLTIWSMFFNCCIVHPSVMFKKSIFNLNHCYGNECSKYPFIEDYLFWLKSIVEMDLNISNIQTNGMPLLYLRKHNSSISHKNFELQKESAYKASNHYLNILFNKFNIEIPQSETVNSNQVIKFLQHPSSSSTLLSIELFELSIEYLISIELACIKQQNNLYSTNIKDATNERMGEIVSLCLSKFPSNPKSELLWKKWLNRNPTSQLLSLLSNLKQTSILDLIGAKTVVKSNNNNNNNNDSKYKDNGIKVICFSKDRAFQLKELLRSFYKYLNNDDEEFQIKVEVLFTYSNEKYQKSYQLVSSLYPQVNFIKEDNFTDQLISVSQKSNTLKYTVFIVDDVLYYNNFNLKQLCNNLNNEPDALGYYMKLNKNITYCHTANQEISIPINLIQGESSTSYLKWNRNDSDCTKDWNYPFDLCSTIYKSKDVELIINGIIKYYGIRNGINHPNRFEFNGNRQIIQKQVYQNKPYCLCDSNNYSSMSVVTINRVQDIYTNPIYDQTLSLDDLDQLLQDNKTLDDQKYRENSLLLNFKSVHIGDLYIK